MTQEHTMTGQPALSPDTVDLLKTLLDSVSLSGADPDLVAKAQRISAARVELAALESE